MESKNAASKAVENFARTLVVALTTEAGSDEELQALKQAHPPTGELDRFETKLRQHKCDGVLECADEFCTLRAQCTCGTLFELNLQDFKCDELHLEGARKEEVRAQYRLRADRLAHFRSIVGTA